MSINVIMEIYGGIITPNILCMIAIHLSARDILTLCAARRDIRDVLLSAKEVWRGRRIVFNISYKYMVNITSSEGLQYEWMKLSVFKTAIKIGAAICITSQLADDETLLKNIAVAINRKRPIMACTSCCVKYLKSGRMSSILSCNITRDVGKCYSCEVYVCRRFGWIETTRFVYGITKCLNCNNANITCCKCRKIWSTKHYIDIPIQDCKKCSGSECISCRQDATLPCLPDINVALKIEKE